MDGSRIEAGTTRRCDVVVLGGGPGGSATATLLAEAGLSVVLVEKDRHPRFHIGESLLPLTLPMLDRLGVLEEVAQIGVHKPGAEFVSADGGKEAIFAFERALTPNPGHAYQVLREEFDEILFRRAGRAGAELREETTARVIASDETGAEIALERQDAPEERIFADLLIDASGRSTVMARMRSEKRPDPRNTSAAIFGHFHDVPRHEGARGGNIRIHLTDPGWMWQIPLQNGVTSIGLVAPGEYMAARSSGIEAFFERHVSRQPHMRSLLAGARRVGTLRATGNFSYHADCAAGPGHLKVGDAYGFIDPVFSTGVHLALSSARDAADAVLAARRRPHARDRLFAQYDRAIRARIARVSWFIYSINDPAFREMMLNPRDILGIERAVIALLAGDFRRSIPLGSRLWLMKLLRHAVAFQMTRKGHQHATPSGPLRRRSAPH